MTEEELQAIEETTNATTAGRWVLDDDGIDVWIDIGGSYDLVFPEPTVQQKIDAEFIVHARCYVLALCAALRTEKGAQ